MKKGQNPLPEHFATSETIVERFLREEKATLHTYSNKCLDLAIDIIDDLRDREDSTPTELIELWPPLGESTLPFRKDIYKWTFHAVLQYGKQVIDPWFGVYSCLDNYMNEVYRKSIRIRRTTIKSS
jgi:hypothetical protein